MGLKTIVWRHGLPPLGKSYQPAVLLDIQRQPGANIIETVERVKKVLPRLTASLPAGIHLSIFSDRTETIRASVARRAIYAWS